MMFICFCMLYIYLFVLMIYIYIYVIYICIFFVLVLEKLSENFQVLQKSVQEKDQTINQLSSKLETSQYKLDRMIKNPQPLEYHRLWFPSHEPL